MKIRLRVVLIVALLAAVIAAPIWSLAQTETVRFFPETGHTVGGDFLAAYESVPDPVRLYGYPITDAFVIEVAGGAETLLVQYFERARFELRPENPAELRVVLSPLGEYLYEKDETIQVLTVPPNFPACRTFPETGYQVCYAFLDFFLDHGGITRFGYPISEIEVRDGRMVQYFQRARFEWHPELPSGQRVVLSDLGRVYFQQYEDQKHLLPNRDNIPFTTLSLQARAFPEKAVISNHDTQTIYVIVQNQNLRAMANAQVTFILQPPSGEEERYVTLTDELGIARLSFPTTGQPYGVITVTIIAQSGGTERDTFQTQTVTSYRVWW